jgi:hypothetical protein
MEGNRNLLGLAARAGGKENRLSAFSIGRMLKV